MQREYKAIRNYNYPVYDDLDDYDEPVRLPQYLPKQECPRCGNQFPGGLKRCTACGLDVTRAFLVPGAASPWPGFERGVIECNSCGYSTADDMARKGRIQKCGQCAKVLYIPSGLYRSEYAGKYPAHPGAPRGFFWLLWDHIGAWLNRFSRSKARVPGAIIIVLLGIGLLLGLNYLKTQSQKVPEKPSELAVYYDHVLGIDKNLKKFEDDFDIGAGGRPAAGDFADKAAPNNRTRFVRATDRILKQVEDFLTDVYSMQSSIPAGAEAHYAAMKAKLEERQRYYARLKDAVEQKNEGRWKEAFAAADVIRDTNTNEEQALNNLQAAVLRPQASTGSRP